MTAETDNDIVAANLRQMKRADDAFNSRDLDGMDALHHHELVAYTTGAAEPTRSVPPHRAVIEGQIRSFEHMQKALHNDMEVHERVLADAKKRSENGSDESSTTE